MSEYYLYTLFSSGSYLTTDDDLPDHEENMPLDFSPPTARPLLYDQYLLLPTDLAQHVIYINTQIQGFAVSL